MQIIVPVVACVSELLNEERSRFSFSSNFLSMRYGGLGAKYTHEFDENAEQLATSL